VQACQGLPESGVCDERTWLALLGPDATPEALDEVRVCRPEGGEGGREGGREGGLLAGAAGACRNASGTGWGELTWLKRW
jgi:hypothetical protein